MFLEASVACLLSVPALLHWHLRDTLLCTCSHLLALRVPNKNTSRLTYSIYLQPWLPPRQTVMHQLLRKPRKPILGASLYVTGNYCPRHFTQAIL